MAEKSEVFVIKTSTVWNAIVLLTFAVVLVNVYMTNNLYTLLATTGSGAAAVATGTQPSTGSAPSAPSAPSVAPSAPSAATAVNIDLSGKLFKGSADAPVTLVEFSDFQCPFCARFYTQTLSAIQSEYVDTGKAKFIYMHFPLNSIHPLAQKAAESSECAGLQGQFWEYHDILFEKNSEWISIGASKFNDYASDLGLDTAQFDTCLESGATADIVNKDLQAGLSSGIRGTPGFLVNGKPVTSGACPFSTFKAAIDAELNGQEWSEANCNIQILS